MKRTIITAALALATITNATASDTLQITNNQTGEYLMFTNEACRFPDLAAKGYKYDLRSSSGEHACYGYTKSDDMLYMAQPDGTRKKSRLSDVQAGFTVTYPQQLAYLSPQQIQAIMYRPTAPTVTCMSWGVMIQCR